MTKQDVINVQNLWAEGIVRLGALASSQDELEQATDTFISTFYAYEEGEVLFKPTMAQQHPVRLEKELAKSYFIGGALPEDKGFALEPWEEIQFKNAGVFFHQDLALAQGRYTFKSSQREVEVDYSFVYKNIAGQLKIILHHSSLCFQS